VQNGGSARVYELPGPITLRESRFAGLQIPIADLARRQLVVVERRGQAQIIRFCAGVAARVKPGS
jgi:hypothetical protein